VALINTCTCEADGTRKISMLSPLPSWHLPHSGTRVKTLLSSVCSQEVITCFTTASTAITCQPGASQSKFKVIMLTLITLTFHSQIEVLFGIKHQKTLKNSIQIHTTQNWKGTGTYSYTDCYSILTYPALRCNLDVLMEKMISTLLNYILSLPMLL